MLLPKCDHWVVRGERVDTLRHFTFVGGLDPDELTPCRVVRRRFFQNDIDQAGNRGRDRICSVMDVITVPPGSVHEFIHTIESIRRVDFNSSFINCLHPVARRGVGR